MHSYTYTHLSTPIQFLPDELFGPGGEKQQSNK